VLFTLSQNRVLSPFSSIPREKMWVMHRSVAERGHYPAKGSVIVQATTPAILPPAGGFGKVAEQDAVAGAADYESLRVSLK
jgi:hypothetical protein